MFMWLYLVANTNFSSIQNKKDLYVPVYTIVMDDEASLGLGVKQACERRRREKLENVKKIEKMCLDAEMIYDQFGIARLQTVPGWDGLMGFIKNKAKQTLLESDLVDTIVDQVQPKLMNLMEVTSITTISLVKARDWQDILLAIVSAYKMITHGNVVSVLSDWSLKLSEFVYKLFPQACGDILQADFGETVLDVVAAMRRCLSDYKSVCYSPLVVKIKQLFRYVLSFSLLESFGIDFRRCYYNKVDEEFIRQDHSSVHDFILTVFDSVTFVVERCVQAYKLKSFTPFYHSEKTYAEWALKARRLEEDSHKLAGSSEMRVNTSQFIADLKDCISKGETIVKFSKGAEKEMLSGLLRTLRIIQTNILTKQAAREERTPPFMCLINGDSSIGKSKLKVFLFQQFGKNFGLPIDDWFRYTRVFSDPFYSGFDTSCWCIVLDDIGLMNPNKAQMDTSLGEVIQIGNPTSFTPPMADLEDKGKNPVRVDLMIGTTNTKDLNAKYYFACEMAILRRFKYVITLEVKDEYREPGEPTMLSPRLASESTDPWPNYWNIHLEKVVAKRGKTGAIEPAYAPIGDFCGETAIYDFMQIFMEIAKNDRVYADADVASTAAMAQIDTCVVCHRPTMCCMCDDADVSSNCDSKMQVLMEPVSDAEEEFADALCEPYEKWDLQDYGDEIPMSVSLRDDLKKCDDDDDSAFERRVASMEELLVQHSTFSLTPSSDFCLSNAIAFAKCKAMGLKLDLHHLSDKMRKYISNCEFSLHAQDFAETVGVIGQKLCTELSGKVMAVLLACLAGASAIYKVVSYFKTGIFSWQNVESKEVPSVEKISNRDLGYAPVCKHDEEENVWKTEEQMLSRFDCGDYTSSLKGKESSEIQRLIESNIVRCVVHYDDGEYRKKSSFVAFCVAGHIYVANSHCLPSAYNRKFDMEMRVTNLVGVTPNFKACLHEDNLFRLQEKDLVFFYIATPPGKDMRDLFPKNSLAGVRAEGKIFVRSEDCSLDVVSLHDVKHEYYNPPGLAEVSAWSGISGRQTVDGECGSPYVIFPKIGPIIVGIHQSLTRNRPHACSIVRDDIDRAVARFGSTIVSKGTPMKEALSLQSLHDKSPLRYFEQGSANVYGSFSNGFIRQAKSKVEPTIISQSVQRKGFALRHGKPVLSGWKPKRIALEPILNIEQRSDYDLMMKCADYFADEILEDLDPKWKQELHEYDDMTTINGAPGVKFVDKMKRNTSIGFPWRGPKRFHMEPATRARSESPDDLDFTPEIYTEIDRILECYKKGERSMSMFTACLKDEALPWAKIEAQKTRVFSISNAPFSFVMRKTLLSFVRMFQSNSILFEGAPGINCSSCNWRVLRDYVTKFGEDHMFAGDYGKFDKHMEATLITVAFHFISRFYEWAGASEELLLRIACIAEDCAYSLTDFFGDLVELFGSNPSGQVLTVIINCIVNCIYMRFCFFKSCPEKLTKDDSIYEEFMKLECANSVPHRDSMLRHFKRFVALMTYGDDNMMGVHQKIDWFNHTSVQKNLADIGVEYTMADKTSETVPFIAIDEISFLKRTWRWEPALGENGDYACPLDFASIEKMLNITLASDFICPQAQAAAIIESACAEFFHYGKEKFELYTQKMKEVINECDLAPYCSKSTILTWDEYVQRWNSGKLSLTLDPCVWKDESCLDTVTA